MIVEARRSKSYNRFPPGGFIAMDTRNNRVKAGPFPGRIINISPHGPCLLMSQVIADTFHLFHPTKENENSCNHLTINIQPEILNCKIPGSPLGKDIFRKGDIRAFKTGVKFMGDANDEQTLPLEHVVSKR